MQKKNTITEEGYKLYKECQRCFYLSYKYGIDRPQKKAKKETLSETVNEEKQKEVKKTFSKGIPLPSTKCVYCKYRHLVKETGVENEIAA